MSRDPVRAIADAVLYEGYVLWPYRRSALKNQRRFTFGGVYPLAHSRAHPDDPAELRTELLVQGTGHTELDVTIRFLQIVRRVVQERQGDSYLPVDALTVAGERHLSWEEAVEREVEVAGLRLAQLAAGHATAIDVPAGSRREQLVENGTAVGALERSWRGLSGELRLRAAPAGERLWRLTAVVRNETPFDQENREEALEHSFCSTHTLLLVREGAFVSATDPPEELREAAHACRNTGTWPVLVGEPGETGTVLSSPIILEDYPRIAPESPGDLFDGGEIDGLLVLNILALTDAEKAEMAASDPRTREILERTEALTPEQLMALHGTVREVGMLR